MSTPPRGGQADGPAPSVPTRLVRAWNDLPGERRLAALAALGLVVTLFLPWYQETVIATGGHALRSASASLTGWGAFSFVEAAVLLVAAGVLVLLFMRAEGAAFHAPGGDGGVITAAGIWAAVLIVWRMFDKEATTVHGQYTTTSGIEWGIFVALVLAGLLAYAGLQIRRAHEPEPPLPGEAGAPASGARTPDMEADETWIQSPQAPRESAPGAPRRKRPITGNELDPQEIRELDLAEPPTSPLGLSEPPTVSDEPTEPPTIRRGDTEPPTSRRGDTEPPTIRRGDTEPPTIRRGDTEPPTIRRGDTEPPTVPLGGDGPGRPPTAGGPPRRRSRR
jgi:hypothetical protein